MKINSEKFRTLVLDTINQLRQRKARPDKLRISHMLKRKHGILAKDTEAQLDNLVDTGIILKVEYKGNISYRNAKKWRALGGYGEILIQDQPTNEGAKASTSTSKQKNSLNSSENGPGPGRPSLTQAPRPRGRPPSKRKKIKKDHGPDFQVFEEEKKKKPKSVRNSESEYSDLEADMVLLDEKCDFCLRTADSNKFGHPEQLLTCTDCRAKAHPSCMNYSEILAKRACNSPWQCIDCKTCYVCQDSGDPDAMLFCDSCDKGYHMSCHSPPLVDKPKGKWACSSCDGGKRICRNGENGESDEDVMSQPHSDAVSCLPTPCDSPTQDGDDEHLKQSIFHYNLLGRMSANGIGDLVDRSSKKRKLDAENYPDASKWTMEEVAEFFRSKGFPKQADAFIEQEIDGKSLLLMKRNDVLTGLSIKLGPALRIYEHIQRLQIACC